MDRRRISGTLLYRRTDGTVTGRELFSVSCHRDGSRTLRAQCEMDDDGIVRDCLLAIDAETRPTEAYVRLLADGTAAGSALFSIADDAISAVTRDAVGRLDRHSRTMPETVRFFGTHSLINDGWLTRLDPGLAIGATAELHDLPACSLAANGATPPQIETTTARLTYEGEDRVTVPAGRFAAQCYAVGYGDYPPLRAWVVGPDRLLVRMTWDFLDGVYELTHSDGALSGEPGPCS